MYKINSLSCRWHVRMNQHKQCQRKQRNHEVSLRSTCSGQHFQFSTVFLLVTDITKYLLYHKEKKHYSIPNHLSHQPQ